MKHFYLFPYMGISGGKIIDGFDILPSLSFIWMPLEEGTFHDIQFSWLFWYIRIGTINKKLKEAGY